jgi:thiamine biosynthesis lipoprotein
MVSVFTRRDVIRQARRLALATPFLSLIACDGGGRRQTELTGPTMGTTYCVKIPHLPRGVEREALERDIAAILETVNARMSTYRPDSELSRFNAGASASWAEVSPDTLAVVDEALRVSRLSGGAFDPTIGPLVDLWGFGPGGAPRAVPSRSRIEATLPATGYRNIGTTDSPPALGKNRHDIRVDLSGIAKGFGVDKVAEHLRRIGVDHYLVEIGGELRGRGYNTRGGVWRVGIERPAALGAPQRIVRLGGQGLATSGDYRIFFERDGARYSHILDARDGRPVGHGLASVTVIAPTAMRADALSTALMVLGPEAGLELARREGVAAFFIARKGASFVETAAPEFARYLIT